MFTTIVKSCLTNAIEVSVKHDTTEAEDSEEVNVYQIDLATNTKAFDPKLSGADEIESTINHTDTATLAASVSDGTDEVKTLTKSNAKWDGKWHKNPSGKTYKGKYCDPKKYSIAALLYKDVAKTTLIDSDSTDVYIVRLGVTAITFGSTGHVELQFHQDLESNKDSHTAHPSTFSEPWVLCDLGKSRNADICAGANKGNPRAIPSFYSERFFPLEGSTLATSSTIPDGTDGSRSYPICYRQDSGVGAKPRITFTTSERGYSQIQDKVLEKDELGYSTCTYAIKLIVKKDSKELTSTDAVKSAAISAGTTYSFDSTDKLDDGIGITKISYSLTWSYEDKTTDPTKPKQVVIPGSITTQHECFRIWDSPKTPWNTGSNKPWIKALDFAIDTCKANGTDTKAALASITSYLHSSHGLTYDTNIGQAKFSSGTLNRTFKLSDYIIKSTGNVVNCYDQAGAVTTMGCLLGIDTKYLFMQPFGYINRTTLVGGHDCNNPFFTNPTYSTEKIVTGLADSSGRPRSKFGNHAFAELTSKIFDACAGPKCGTENRAEYIGNVINSALPGAGTSANIQNGSVTGIQ